MPLPKKNHYDIYEAARYIGSATGEKVSTSQIFDWGTQGHYGLYLLDDCHVKYEGTADVVELLGAEVKFYPNGKQVQTLELGYSIAIDCGWHEGRKVIFMKSPKQLRPHEYRATESPANFNSTSVILRGSELEAFVASLAKVPSTNGAEPPETDKPLSTKERNTLLVIIAALARAAKIDLSKPSKAGESIANLTEIIGAPVDHATVEQKIRQIADALESRAK